MTGHHVDDHGILGENIFSQKEEKVVSLSNTSAWESAQSFDTIWVGIDTDLATTHCKICINIIFQDLEKNFRACNWPYAQHLVQESEIANISPPLPRPNLVVNETVLDRVGSSSSSNSQNWTTCLNSAMQWLVEDKVHFVSIFLNEPGDTAEIYGPESEETAKAVKVIDDKVGQLLDRLEHEAPELWPNKLNLIFTSTPGFASVTPDHLIDLSTIVKPEFYMPIGESPVLNIHPLKKELFVYEELRKGEKENEFEVFIKEEFPPNSHYAINENVQELIVVANEGYAFRFDGQSRLDDLKAKRGGNVTGSTVYGMSGYNNTLKSMQTFILAQVIIWKKTSRIIMYQSPIAYFKGPDLAQGGTVVPSDPHQQPHPNSPSATQYQGHGLHQPEEAVRVVDMFVLLCNLLEITCPKHVNGDAKRINAMLRYSSDTTQVVKVIRSWISVAFDPQNAPVSSSLYFLVFSFFISLFCCSCCWRFGFDCTLSLDWPLHLLHTTMLWAKNARPTFFCWLQIYSSVSLVHLFGAILFFDFQQLAIIPNWKISPTP